MIKFNYWLQSAIMITAIALAIAGLIENTYRAYLLYLQMFTGLLQVVASMIFNIIKRFRSALSQMHLMLASALLLFLGVVKPEQGIIILVFVIPWILAVLFWYVSYKLYKRTK